MGYQRLMNHEMSIMRQTMEAHKPILDLWDELLNLAVSSSSARIVDHPDRDTRIAQNVRLHFFSLGVSQAKAALDASLYGNYHIAFYSVRYMCELLIQAIYIRAKPDQAYKWYRELDDGKRDQVKPRAKKALTVIRAAFPAEARHFNVIAEWLEQMNDLGAHPSQETLSRTLTRQGEAINFGTVYDKALFLFASNKAILIATGLVLELGKEGAEDPEEWEVKMSALMNRHNDVFTSIEEPR